MILTYSKEQFKSYIKFGIKIHTIRSDKSNRWRVGMAIQHWFGNPRNIKNNPHEFAVGECKGVQYISINPENRIVLIRDSEQEHGTRLTDKDIFALAINDGFDSDKQFWAWFHEPFVGKIIHFTDFKYKKL